MSDHTNAWSRVTCDMTDSEFCAWVRERCEMTLRNTAAGVYMQGLIDRLMASESENARLREELLSFDNRAELFDQEQASEVLEQIAERLRLRWRTHRGV